MFFVVDPRRKERTFLVAVISVGQSLPQFMTRRLENYFRYFATSPESALWGLDVTAAGYTLVKPGSSYPPALHPTDHDFRWERGRVLDVMQIVLVASGGGEFETRTAGPLRIRPGDAFVILPGVWHRYRPDVTTGWEESWIEVRGPVAQNLIETSIFQPHAPVNHGTFENGMHEALEAVHSRSRKGSPGFDAGRVAAGFNVLAAWQLALQALPKQNRMARAVSEAEHYLAEHFTEPVDIEQLARKLGVAYSHFRREFKLHTGFAPWQYMVHLRLSRARRMLASGDAPLDEIADQLNFSSASHFSVAFKKVYGISPAIWRRELESHHESTD